jgi:formylglycine-generating enzyme required for sulfatase activity
MTTAEQLGGQRKKWSEYLVPENPDRHPVVGVSWTDAETYCVRRSEQDGVTYRLPSEAEWEYACRAGTTTLWSFGDNPAQIGEYAVTTPEGTFTQQVGVRKPNPLGLFDMYGNAEEWCLDWHTQDFYATCPTEDPVNLKMPTDPNSGRVARGCGTLSLPWQLRSSTRRWDFPSTPVNLKGFRVVITGDLKTAATSIAATGWQGWPSDAPAPAIAPFNAEQAKQHQEAWAKYLNVPVDYTNSIGMKFVLIPPGEFMMGSSPEEIAQALGSAGDDKLWQETINSEGPRYNVVLTKATYIGVHEVTQGQFAQVMGRNPSRFGPMGASKDVIADLDTSNFPVEKVSWDEATRFCIELSEVQSLAEDNAYRLLTDAEWEFACRAGTTTEYWIGENEQERLQTAWIYENSSERTHAVGELKENPFGLYDVHGNVWEWVQDAWDPTFYDQRQGQLAVDPIKPSVAGAPHVTRGGCWSSSIASSRSASRSPETAAYSGTLIGFRVSLAVEAVRETLKRTVGSPTSGGPNDNASMLQPMAPGWLDRVSRLSPEEQVTEFTAEMKRRNPEWDGVVTPTIADGQVVGITVDSLNLKDLSPIVVFSSLRELKASSSKINRELSDLTPFAQMKSLTTVYLGECEKIVDLSPLRDLPITSLIISNSGVSDLSPMAGKPLQLFNANYCVALTDLAPLRGAPLQFYLGLEHSGVTDLTPIRESPVGVLAYNADRLENNWETIKNWPLIDFQCFHEIPTETLSKLKEIKTLEKIDSVPLEEYLKSAEKSPESN